jgi:cytochrome P450
MAHTHEGTLGPLYHPLQGEQLENPYLFYARARQEEPVFFSPDLEAWVVTRYEDVLAVLNQPDLFSSKDALHPVVKLPPEVLAELRKGFPPVPGTIERDGTDHTLMRNAVGRAFAPRRMKILEPFIRKVAASLVDAFIQDSKAELISQFAYPLPLEVVLFLIGVPKADMAMAKKLSDGASLLFSARLPAEQLVECARDFVRIQHYFLELLNERRSAPREDLMSDLLALPPGERPFTDPELARALTGTLVAGHETTSQLIGNGLAILLDPRERWQTLCTHPEMIPQAIEEILRYDSPVPVFFRTTTQEVNVGGVMLPPETLLMVVFGSANQDERQFPHANQFEMQRLPNRHFAFGHGSHFCLGAFLARKEGQIAFETLCQRLPDLRLAPNQTFSHAPVLRHRGFERLEVEW